MTLQMIPNHPHLHISVNHALQTHMHHHTSSLSLSGEDTYKQRCTELSTKELIKLLQSRAPEGMKHHICLMSKDETVPIESVIKSEGKPTVVNHEVPKKRKRVNMYGSILTNESFKEKVELFKKESTPK